MIDWKAKWDEGTDGKIWISSDGGPTNIITGKFVDEKKMFIPSAALDAINGQRSFMLYNWAEDRFQYESRLIWNGLSTKTLEDTEPESTVPAV